MGWLHNVTLGFTSLGGSIRKFGHEGIAATALDLGSGQADHKFDE